MSVTVHFAIYIWHPAAGLQCRCAVCSYALLKQPSDEVSIDEAVPAGRSNHARLQCQAGRNGASIGLALP